MMYVSLPRVYCTVWPGQFTSFSIDEHDDSRPPTSEDREWGSGRLPQLPCKSYNADILKCQGDCLSTLFSAARSLSNIFLEYDHTMQCPSVVKVAKMVPYILPQTLSIFCIYFPHFSHIFLLHFDAQGNQTLLRKT